MNQIETVSVVGGDSRQLYTARRLEEYGFPVSLAGFENHGGVPAIPEVLPAEALQSSAAVLPLPCTKNGRTLNAPFAAGEIPLKAVLEAAAPGSVFFVGMAPEGFRKSLEAAGAQVFDYYRSEALTLQNARLTAEGALGIIIEKTPVTVWRMNAAVTGYGRISRFLCRMLQSLGAKVTVYARDPVQRALAETEGLSAQPLSLLPEQTHRFDVIVNTVPAPVIGADAVENAGERCLFIETASAPYGIDADACKRYNRELVKAFSLPGRTAPVTAGILIADAVAGMMKEANLWNP